jgi:maleamate amidohydrolase
MSGSDASDAKYRSQGFGALGIGFGERPAIVVVDFQNGFTRPGFVLGGSPLVDAAVERSVGLLRLARSRGLPVVQAFAGSHGARDALNWKMPSVRADFHVGKPECEIDSRIFDPAYDVVIQKIGPSVFFQTHAISYLIKSRVDTVIVIGCNTSGCVRATIVDAFSYGFRVIVPHECCGDVDSEPHNDNLRDVGRRYADVVSLDAVTDHLNRIPAQSVAEGLQG